MPQLIDKIIELEEELKRIEMERRAYMISNIGDITEIGLEENLALRTAKRLFSKYKKMSNSPLIKKVMGGLIKRRLEVTLNKILETPPNSSNYNHECALTIKGAMALLEHEYDDAIAFLANLNTFPAYKLLGIAHYGNGCVHMAADALERALQLLPDVETYNMLGEVKQRNSDVNGAIEAHEKAYDIDNANKEANTELARLYREKATTLETEILNEAGVNTIALQNFKDVIKTYAHLDYVKARELANQVVAMLATPLNDNEKLVKARAFHYLACASAEYKDAISYLRQSLTAKPTKNVYIAIAENHEKLAAKENAKT